MGEAIKAFEPQTSIPSQALGRGFGLYPKNSGKPLKSFKQGSNMVSGAFC